jgi:hypothetical protein
MRSREALVAPQHPMAPGAPSAGLLFMGDGCNLATDLEQR